VPNARPQHGDASLWDLLTDPCMEGLEVTFPHCGLVYTVGPGWRTREGHALTRPQAYRILRVGWHEMNNEARLAGPAKWRERRDAVG
jgi:hypothetical protein